MTLRAEPWVQRKRLEEQLQRQWVQRQRPMKLPWVQWTEPQVTENHSQDLEPNGIYPGRFQTCFRLVTPLFLPISPLWNGNVYLAIVFWKQTNCFLVSQAHRWRDFVTGWIMPRACQTWCRWWDSRLLSWWYLDFGLSVDSVVGWDFSGWGEYILHVTNVNSGGLDGGL